MIENEQNQKKDKSGKIYTKLLLNKNASTGNTGKEQSKHSIKRGGGKTKKINGVIILEVWETTKK